MAGLGHSEKNSRRAYLVCISPSVSLGRSESRQYRTLLMRQRKFTSSSMVRGLNRYRVRSRCKNILSPSKSLCDQCPPRHYPFLEVVGGRGIVYVRQRHGHGRALDRSDNFCNRIPRREFVDGAGIRMHSAAIRNHHAICRLSCFDRTLQSLLGRNRRSARLQYRLDSRLSTNIPCKQMT